MTLRQKDPATKRLATKRLRRIGCDESDRDEMGVNQISFQFVTYGKVDERVGCQMIIETLG